MDMHEFNDAVSKLTPAYQKALQTTSEADIADLYIAAAVNGLTIAPFEHYKGDEIPQPICQMIRVPDPEKIATGVNAYLYPSDQH